MSAPETNIEKQKRRHFGPIIGIAAGLVFAAIILVVYLVTISGSGEEIPGATDEPEVVAPATVTE